MFVPFRSPPTLRLGSCRRASDESVKHADTILKSRRGVCSAQRRQRSQRQPRKRYRAVRVTLALRCGFLEMLFAQAASLPVVAKRANERERNYEAGRSPCAPLANDEEMTA